MATKFTQELKNKGTHAVGHVTSFKRYPVPNGAIVIDADVDNYTIVEKAGYDEAGNLQVKQLSDNTKKGFLVTTPVVLPTGLVNDPEYFFNAVGEKATIEEMKPETTRFETSAYSLNAGVTEAKYGFVAHFDVATKKFIISDPATPHADYNASATKLEIVEPDCDTFNVPTIRFAVIQNG